MSVCEQMKVRSRLPPIGLGQPSASPPSSKRPRSGDWSHADFPARLVAEQADATRNRCLAARLRCAKFPIRKTIAEFDFKFQPTADPLPTERAAASASTRSWGSGQSDGARHVL